MLMIEDDDVRGVDVDRLWNVDLKLDPQNWEDGFDQA